MNPIEERDSLAKRDIVYTAGEVFSDGSAIELVSAGSKPGLALLYWKHSRAVVRSHIDIADHRYVPLPLEATLLESTILPRGAAKSINSKTLLSNLTKLFELYVGFPSAQSPLLAAWAVSTWIPECWLRAPDLAITGWNMDDAMLLLRLLSCFTRRGLLLTGVERTTFHSLPMQFCPTLLINQPSISVRTLDFLRASNYRDVVVSGARGHVSRTAGSKALFLGVHAVETDGLRISLPPTQSRTAPLSMMECQRLAEEFQPQMLRYRLQYLTRFCNGHSTNTQKPFAEGFLLQHCIEDDPEFKERVAAIVATRNEEIRAERFRKPEVAAVEVLWEPSHGSKELKVNEITKLVNTLIRTRGETLEYNDVEIGQLLRNIGLPRRRNGSGMVLRFSAENRQRLHGLARDFGLRLEKMDGCAICELTQ